MPGSQEEMTKFQEDTVASSKVHVECTFPRLDVNLHTKDVFENIYNRWVDYREEMKVLQSTWNYSSWRKEKKKKEICLSWISKHIYMYGWTRSLSCALIELLGRLGDGRNST